VIDRDIFMPKPQRNLILIIVPIALLVVWLAFADGVFSRPADNENAAADGQTAAHFHRAAKSIVEGAKQRIAEATTDEEALQRAQMTFEALRIVEALGRISTNAEAGELLDGVQRSGRTAVVEAIIQMKLSSAFQQWQNMNASARAAVINGFVADVKRTGLTSNEAQLFMRITNYFGDDEPKLMIKAIREIVPLAKKSDDAEVKRSALVFEGVARRIDLPGKPLELEGKLLDGSKLDWNSYRGKVVLVDYHASWCGPCRAEVPNILQNYEAYRNKGFDVLGINMDKDKSGAEKYIHETGFKFPVVFGEDPNARGWDLPLARKYGVTGIPRVFLVGKDGNVVSTQARGEQLGMLLKQLLGEPDQVPANRTSKTEDSSVKQASAEEAAPADAAPSDPAPAEPAPLEPAPDASAAPEPPK
jgi:thiol-disulfide isomerase/thioredoxin